MKLPNGNMVISQWHMSPLKNSQLFFSPGCRRQVKRLAAKSKGNVNNRLNKAILVYLEPSV